MRLTIQPFLEVFMWSLLRVGQRAGRSLAQILFRTHTIVLGSRKEELPKSLATEAAVLAWKARHFKIRKQGPENRHVEYFFT
jgi:hypothetical protein